MMNLSRTPSSPEEEKGIPITIAATHLDGLVLALTPNSHSYNYRSAVLFGHATLVEDPEEKLYAMELITNSVVPNRWQNSRIPPNKTEMTSTSVLRVRISTGSAKIRSGEPHDDRGDLEDEELKQRVWTGVVPVSLQFGEPIPASYNLVEGVPGYLEGWRGEVNEEGRRAAVEATVEPGEKK